MTTVSSFEPPGWLRGAHGQTLFSRYLRPEGGVDLRRERITTPDGDFLDLDWAFSSFLADRLRPLVLVLHGLEGSARSRYALELYRQLGARGIPSVGLNFRGCSGEPNRGRRFYHSGETDDPRYVISLIRNRFPGRSLAAVGFSLGGNVLLKYLGEEANESPLSCASALSVPFDLAVGARYVESGFSRIYMLKLLRSLKRKVHVRRSEVSDLCDVPSAMRASNFWEYDDAVTSLIHGFDSAEHYYRECSSSHFVSRITTPTLLLQAGDDPFLPQSAIPIDAIRANDALELILSERGGHVGFLDRSLCFWGEQMAANFIADSLLSDGGAD